MHCPSSVSQTFKEIFIGAVVASGKQKIGLWVGSQNARGDGAELAAIAPSMLRNQAGYFAVM